MEKTRHAVVECELVRMIEFESAAAPRATLPQDPTKVSCIVT